MKDVVIGLVCWVGTIPRLLAVSFMTTPTWSSYLLNSNILQQLIESTFHVSFPLLKNDLPYFLCNAVCLNVSIIHIETYTYLVGGLNPPFKASPPFPQQLQPPSIALTSVALRHEPPWCLWRHLPDPRRYSVRWCPQTDERNVSHGISNRICDGPIRCVYIYDILDIHIYI